MKYATFSQRFAAMLIDTFVLLPFAVGYMRIQSTSRAAAMVLLVPMAVAFAGYHIYCHGRFGQTIGKHAMAIRVVRTTGERIGWREAWLRSSIDVMLSVLHVVSSFVALAAIADAQYYGVGWMQRFDSLKALEPTWLVWTGAAGQIWTWSELVVMMLNERRRALHDFVAGTVVVSEERASARQTQAA